jgi:predicted O-methyltransferase YrrM
MSKIPSAVIFNTLRILKRINPGDLYYEAYLGHYQKQGEKFFDIYHFMWEWVIDHSPKSILEIGTRTGLSLCQLLSAYTDYSNIERIVSCDLYNDGFISPSLVKLNLKTLNIPQYIIDKVEFLIGDSKVIIPLLSKDKPESKFDYILVDGSHDKLDARLDLENVRPLVAQGGVLLFDDISPDGMSLDDVWQEFKLSYQNEFDWSENYNGKGIGIAIKK